MYYDASLFYKEKRRVRTLVIYSADIREVETHIDAGTIKYDMEVFLMKNLNGDKKFQYLRNKIHNKEHLSAEDILTLTFIPLMDSRDSSSNRAIESIELADSIPESNEKMQCLTLLYALLEKFGDELAKIKFKEVFRMTEIGRMLREEGIREGIEEGKREGIKEGIKEGKTEGKAEILIKQLIKKFKVIPSEYKEKIKKLSEETIDVIATDIFDIEKVEDLENYFE